VFAVVLLAAVLLSSLANRTVLSTAALFLVAGFVLGDASLGVLHIQADDELVSGVAELAIFSILFSDGMRSGYATSGRPGGSPAERSASGSRSPWSSPQHSPTTSGASRGSSRCSSAPS